MKYDRVPEQTKSPTKMAARDRQTETNIHVIYNRDVTETLPSSETETRPRLLILSPRQDQDRNRDLPKFS